MEEKIQQHPPQVLAVKGAGASSIKSTFSSIASKALTKPSLSAFLSKRKKSIPRADPLVFIFGFSALVYALLLYFELLHAMIQGGDPRLPVPSSSLLDPMTPKEQAAAQGEANSSATEGGKGQERGGERLKRTESNPMMTTTLEQEPIEGAMRRSVSTPPLVPDQPLSAFSSSSPPPSVQHNFQRRSNAAQAGGGHKIPSETLGHRDEREGSKDSEMTENTLESKSYDIITPPESPRNIRREETKSKLDKDVSGSRAQYEHATLRAERKGKEEQVVEAEAPSVSKEFKLVKEDPIYESSEGDSSD
ncbi:hypothetical protein IE53DRAFT_376644 [Violaceomyces palustris]|uniref:Uncharacterized protein n=1 Tax=Violaceomyces palustris TaxID=1673888 RepID=A0ACD0P8H1_9BASI|nr:hypothetical protein IE53DRAFT_376644 [Violaceomyces palustris]